MTIFPGPPTHRGRFPLVVGVVALASFWSWPASAQKTLFDPRFEEVRRASVTWDNRGGPDREVVDMVCLVPDFATYLDAVSTWDDRHFFPVLIDDVEYTLKFLRAFRPARVVRYPGRASAVTPEVAWERAVAAVGKTWTGADAPAGKAQRGDALPTGLGPVPPGVVVSNPDSPTLAAAVALAAGRFQPLLRWETPKHYADVLSADEAKTLATSLETRISSLVPRYDALGDDCDFVTLAGDYPYRYDAKGVNAFDDLILRGPEGRRRWAFAGRLGGDATRGVYQAMCSLFLHPSNALLFNGYTQKERPWTEYAMDAALERLSPELKASLRNGERASFAGWHQAFDPVNPYGLLLINTSGSPTVFHLDGGPAHTADVPETVPTAVSIIHSYSAESPDDPETIAGRWLSNGAFAYFGSVNEPYLQAFRPPGLVASFLAEKLPMVTAVRKTAAEPGGEPWKLIYLGDPLYRIKARGKSSARLSTWAPVSAWPAYGEFQQPGTDEPETLRLKWALKSAIFGTQTATAPQQKLDLPGTLLGIARDRLETVLRPLYDDLLVDALLRADRPVELIDRLRRIPPAQRSPTVRRHLETAQTAALQRAVTSKNPRQATSLWAEVVHAPGSRDFVKIFTDRVARMFDESQGRLADWQSRLNNALRADPDPANVPIIESELRRVSEKIAGMKGR